MPKSKGGRVPVPAVESLKKVNGNRAKIILVTVFGNRAYDDTLLELKDIVEEAGFVCIAAIATVTEHSIVHKFGSKRPDEQDRQQLQKYAVQIFNMLSAGQDFGTLTVPGKRPYREYHGLPLHPKADKSCSRWGICAGICPVGAIPQENLRETDSQKCITCMACVSACPHNARKLNPILLAVAFNKMKKACCDRKKNELRAGRDHLW